MGLKLRFSHPLLNKPKSRHSQPAESDKMELYHVLIVLQMIVCCICVFATFCPSAGGRAWSLVRKLVSRVIGRPRSFISSKLPKDWRSLAGQLLLLSAVQIVFVTYQLVFVLHYTDRKSHRLTDMGCGVVILLITNTPSIVTALLLYKLPFRTLRWKIEEKLFLGMLLFTSTVGAHTLLLRYEDHLWPPLEGLLWLLTLAVQGAIQGLLDILLMELTAHLCTSISSQVAVKLFVFYVAAALAFVIELLGGDHLYRSVSIVLGFSAIVTCLVYYRHQPTIQLPPMPQLSQPLSRSYLEELVRSIQWPEIQQHTVIFKNRRAPIFLGLCFIGVYGPLSMVIFQTHLNLPRLLRSIKDHLEDEKFPASLYYLSIVLAASTLFLLTKRGLLKDGSVFRSLAFIWLSLYGISSALQMVLVNRSYHPILGFTFVLFCYSVAEENVKLILSEILNRETDSSDTVISGFIELTVSVVHVCFALAGIVWLTYVEQLGIVSQSILSFTLKGTFPVFAAGIVAAFLHIDMKTVLYSNSLDSLLQKL